MMLKYNEFKNHLYEEKKRKMKLERKIEMFEIEVNELTMVVNEDIEKGGALARLRKGKAGANPSLNKKMIAERKRRERDLLKKQLARGIDHLGDTEVRIKGKANRGWFEKRFANLAAFLW
jgi:hypothetical protein